MIAVTALLTTKQVADRLGLTVQRVNQLARARGVGQLDPRWNYRLFTEADVAALEVRKVGRPKREQEG